MRKNDAIVIGELNIDLILNGMSSFPELGKEILSSQATLTLGSSSAIFASNLSSLGASVGFIGKIGKDAFGKFVMNTLRKKDIDTTGILEVENGNTGVTVALNYGEDRAMVTHPGAMEQLSFDDIEWEYVQQAKHLHISSYFIQPQLKKDIRQIFQKAKTFGLTTSFDPQWDPAEKWNLDIFGILPYVDIFLPNEQELLHLTHTTDAEVAIEQLHSLAGIAVIKQGSKGSTLVSNRQQTFHPAYLNDTMVDAIGAGDSFNAGFVFKFLQGAPPEACQRFANVTASFSTTAAGGTGAFSETRQSLEKIKERYSYE